MRPIKPSSVEVRGRRLGTIPATQSIFGRIADRGIDFIKTSRDSDEAFALFVSFTDPHHPFSPPSAYADLFGPEDMPPPSASGEGELDRMPTYRHFCDDLGKEAYIGPGEKVREQGFMLRTEAISLQALSRATAHTMA